MIRVNEIKIPLDGDKNDILKSAAKALRISPDKIKDFSVVKKSLDSRKKDDLPLTATRIKFSQKQRRKRPSKQSRLFMFCRRIKDPAICAPLLRASAPEECLPPSLLRGRVLCR